MKRIYCIHKYLLASSLFLCPFLSSLNVDFLGGLGKEASFYPIVLGVILWLIQIAFFHERVYFPREKSFYCFCFFFIAVILSGLLNIDHILIDTFKGINGATRFIIQSGTVFFYIFSALYVYNVFLQLHINPVYFFSKYIKLSFIIAGVYSLFELGQLFFIPSCHEAILFLDSIFRGSQEGLAIDVFSYTKIRSLANEASYFGMYVGIILPWFLLSIFHNQGKIKLMYTILLLYILILVVFSTSRTAYMMTAIEIIIFLFLFRDRIQKNIVKVLALFILTIVIVIIFLSQDNTQEGIDIAQIFMSLLFSDGTTYDLSNIGRKGSQVAALRMWMDYPFFGVGYGQYGFYASEYFPSWAWLSREVISWASNIPGTLWTPSHGLYTRLLAETGIFGFACFISGYLFLASEMLEIIKKSADNPLVKDYMYTALTTFMAFVMFGFNVDGLRYLFMWIFYAAIWIIHAETESNHANNSASTIETLMR